jgi:hypothetical protein
LEIVNQLIKQKIGTIAISKHDKKDEENTWIVVIHNSNYKYEFKRYTIYDKKYNEEIIFSIRENKKCTTAQNT